MADHDEMNCLYKVLVVGEGGAGKTSIIRRYVHNIFQMTTKPTIGVDFALKMLHWQGKKQITLQVWDIAGQERYGQMTRVYYQAAVGALVVFDIKKQDSFAAVAKWKLDIDNKVYMPDGSCIPCVLLANKCDLAPLSDFKTKEEMDAFCQEHNFVAWFETSAMKDINIQPAFEKLVEQIVANDNPKTDDANADRNNANVISLSAQKSDSKGGCRC
ncbi:Ras-related protein Rab-32A [Diplonema papillatum]|nr:Ras-related protein Rab-32A [Diplonema papillatum]